MKSRKLLALSFVCVLPLLAQSMPDAILTPGDATPYAAGPLTEASMPNPRLTPGAVLAVTAAQVCVPGYADGVRHSKPRPNEKRAYKTYGIKHHGKREYEVDHLISLELGGSNLPSNLWPESYTIQWNAHVKDRLEDRLHHMVCYEGLSLKTAQQWISTDWIDAYQRIFGNP